MTSTFSKGNGRQSQKGHHVPGEAKRRTSDLTSLQMKYPKADELPEVPAQTNGEFKTAYKHMGAVYSRPTQAKKSWQFKKAVMDSGVLAPSKSGKGASSMVWSPTDKDMAIMEQHWDEIQNRDFDAWLSQLVDLRQPGRAQWLSNVFPDFIGKQVAALDEKLDLQKRLQVISQFGPRTQDDFYLMYMVQTGQLQDNSENPVGSDTYIQGMLAPKYKRGGFPGWLTGIFDSGKSDNNFMADPSANDALFEKDASRWLSLAGKGKKNKSDASMFPISGGSWL